MRRHQVLLAHPLLNYGRYNAVKFQHTLDILKLLNTLCLSIMALLCTVNGLLAENPICLRKTQLQIFVASARQHSMPA